MLIERSQKEVVLALGARNGHALSRNGHERDELRARAERAIARAVAARGVWRARWRTCQIAWVLGWLALCLFLENYDARARYQQRVRLKQREEARRRGAVSRLQFWSRDLGARARDLLIRAARAVLFGARSASPGGEARLVKQARWFKQQLIRLGPTFIKIGQALATRADLLPLAYIRELETLQDQVPPFAVEQARATLEGELGRGVEEAFAEVEWTPIAAASLGQVHRAKLHTGEDVAVKIQRPHLEETVSFDIAVLRRVVAFLARHPQLNENADWSGMLDEFTETIFEEMDYVREAQNADRFRENFQTWRAVHVPKIYWTHTTTRVLTMEFIRGTKVTDLEALRARRISPVKVNRLLVRTYLKQLLEDGFFHADPHPGNLLVMDDGRLAFFDFGMVGRITPHLQSLMVDAFFHVINREVHALADDLFKLNFLKPGFDPEFVRPVIEKLFEKHLELKLGEVNFKELTYELADVVYAYPFRLPANFTYIMRALMTLEGIGLITDPEFNFFDTARPYAKRLVLQREGRQLRRTLAAKILGRNGNEPMDWGRIWKLTKWAARAYLES